MKPDHVIDFINPAML